MSYWIVRKKSDLAVGEKIRELPEGTDEAAARSILATYPDDARLLVDITDAEKDRSLEPGGTD